MKKTDWGFDTRDMDRKVRPQDDLYRYANGGWLAKNPIPPHESRWGSFLILRFDTEKRLAAILSDLTKKKNLPAGTPEQMVRDFYASGMDMKRRNALGLAPIQTWLDKIDAIKDLKSLVRALAAFEKIGGLAPWGIILDQDMKDSERYILYLAQGGLGMPDRDYYLKDDAESKRVRAAYEAHLGRMFGLMGYGKASAEARSAVMRIETALAKASMPKEEVRDVDKTYHKMRLSALAKLSPQADWETYFRVMGAGAPKEVVVMQPEFLKAAGKLLAEEPLEDWKTYLRFHLVSGTAGVLSEKFEKERFAFYGTALAGIPKMKPLWRRAMSVVNGSLGEPLGKLYVERHFPRAAKKKINEVVDDLFAAYEARIKNLDWMSPATKKKALKKLSEINRKLGYPDKWKSYKGLVIRPDDYAGNALRTAAYEHARAMRRLKKPVDRAEWFMSPQTVNAYCSFGLNDVVFPAAILQPPFFSVTADDGLNYGGIGAVIGHEITHAFDDQGSKFDGKGNRKTWWTDEDRKRFEKKAQVLVKQFNAYKVASGIPVNGQLTLGENIADLGGASIAYDAYRMRLAKTGRQDVDGFSPEQRFFLGFALFERENRRPEMEKTQVLTDPHSPGIFRINGPASNLPEFYEAFGITPKDRLYRKPSERAKVW